MNQSADFNSFDGGEPIADLREELNDEAHKASVFVYYVDNMERIFVEHWSPREHGVMKVIFEEHWQQVGKSGMPDSIGKLFKIAQGAVNNPDVKNPPAYFTKCAKDLLK